MTDADGRPIVAELGRPETPEETRIRKDANRRAHRANQTTLNLVLSLAASLAIVLFLVAVVVRPDQSTRAAVDYRQVAAQAQVPGVTIAAPELPSGFTSNRADYQDAPSDGVPVWTVGFITPDEQYIGLHQGIGANKTWVSNVLQEHAATGSRTIDGTKWTVVDRRSEGSDAGNLAYSLVGTFGKSTIVLAGTADDRSFRTLATGVAAQQDR
ncbi:DUF4245 domain-containing protein [Curtobacterium sp. RRHDQ10]|uniref:DUF4245 domain-containing protein n=1 Tax=Curtobacterium phyllosphaerae TaxID=3413379 RepID=UPI003BF00A11